MNILITGASSGIGAATAERLAQEGHTVILMARRVEKLEALKKTIEGQGGKALIAAGDVTNFNAIQDTYQNLLKELGHIDVVINNAGVMPLSFLKNGKVNEAHQMVDVNIKGVINMIYSALPSMMEKNKGHIINVSSTAGRKVFPSSAIYSGTKFAVRAISDGLRMEMAGARKDVRVTDIQPGAVETELTHTITDQEVLEMFEKMGEMEIMQSDDIARAISYAIKQPRNVNVNEILIRTTSQSF